MRYKILIFLFSMLYLTGFSQNDHLEPINGFFDTPDDQLSYYNDIKDILLKDVSPLPVIRFMFIPSFFPESTFQIDYYGESQQYYLTYTKSQKSIWSFTMQVDSMPDIERTEKRIDEQDVKLIEQLFNKAIYDSRFISKDYWIPDANAYIFSINDSGFKSAMTLNPKKDTKLDLLTQICRDIIDVIDENDIIILSPKLKTDIVNLIDQF